MNARPCRTYRSRIGARKADVLLHDLKQVTIPNGRYNCPMDDGSSVQIWFSTTSGNASFRIGLRGCAFYLSPARRDLGTWPAPMRSLAGS
ncbi:hypothetical protein [Nocardioides ultimimeridianus]